MELSPLHERIHTAVGRLTYRALAEATDQHPETVRRYMQGQVPSADFLAALCFKFDVNAQWLLTGQGPVKHTEARTYALREANPSELLAAIAAALERLTERVDRIELFVQTLETRVRAARPDPAETDRTQSGSTHEAKKLGATRAGTERSKHIADALPERPHQDAD